MLLKEFDRDRNAVINPDMIVQRIPDFPEVTVSCFSRQLFLSVLSLFDSKQICEIRCAVGPNPVYEAEYKKRRFALFQSRVGEPLCVSDYEDMIAMGSKRLILLGNCGVLDNSIEDCGIIIPTRAIRDEGTSYHYAAPSDTIEVNKKYRDLFKATLAECGYPFVEGTTWTTDAIYRETREKVRRRKKQGAICVEMECAGLQALCDFRKTEFFQFFYAGDNLDHSTWDPRSLSGDVRLDDKTKIMLLAFELGLKIMDSQEKQAPDTTSAGLSGKGENEMKLAVIFEPKPETWGFRGDPYFWAHLKELAKDMDVLSPEELEEWIRKEHSRVSGIELDFDSVAVVEQFAHGGMSSGGLSGQWWIEDGIPLLKSRLRELKNK